jgi:hypothetical protein
MNINIEDLKEIMQQIKEYSYPKSKQVELFIEDILEHFGNPVTGANQ